MRSRSEEPRHQAEAFAPARSSVAERAGFQAQLLAYGGFKVGGQCGGPVGQPRCAARSLEQIFDPCRFGHSVPELSGFLTSPSPQKGIADILNVCPICLALGIQRGALTDKSGARLQIPGLVCILWCVMTNIERGPPMF